MSKCSQVAQVLSNVCSCKLWPKTAFALVHHSCEEVAVFVHRRVFDQASSRSSTLGWIEKLCSKQPSLVGDWSCVLGSAQLLSHVLEAVHQKEKFTIEQVQLGIGVRVQL